MLGYVAVASACQHQFAASVLGLAAEQRMLRKQLKGSINAVDLPSGGAGVFLGNEIEQPLQIEERPLAYFDPRQDRGFGRRTRLPSMRATRYLKLSSKG